MSFPLKELKDTVGYSVFGAELGYVGGTWNFGTNISNGILTIYIYIYNTFPTGREAFTFLKNENVRDLLSVILTRIRNGQNEYEKISWTENT